MTGYLKCDSGYINIDKDVVRIVDKDSATEVELHDVPTIKEMIRGLNPTVINIEFEYKNTDGKVKMTMGDFLNQCTACGGNWGGMLLTGIKKVFPDSYDEVEKEYNSMDFSHGGIYPFAFLCDWLTEHGIYEEVD